MEGDVSAEYVAAIALLVGMFGLAIMAWDAWK